MPADLCAVHDEPIAWERGGDDMPTIRGRWYCPLCSQDLAQALDALDAE